MRSYSLKQADAFLSVLLCAIVLVCTVALIHCGPAPSNVSGVSSESKAQGPTDALAATPASDSATAPAELARRKKRLAELKPHFVFSTDEFNHTLTIRHKAFSKFMNGNGTTIEAEINDGKLSLESQFVSSEWIFHKSFVVKVRDAQVTADGYSREEVMNGVVETVTAPSDQSVSVARLIASTGSDPVRVRLEGKFYKDYTLRPIHQRAIAETLEYFDLMGSQ